MHQNKNERHNSEALPEAGGRVLGGPSQQLGRAALFLGFFKIGLCGFGGVASWARRVIVEERAWLDEQAYAELLGVASILPGANTVNIAVLLGDRSCGPSGSLCALAGLLCMPLIILFVIASFYTRYAVQTDIRHAVAGAAAATAGLVIGTGLKMLRNLNPDALALVAGGGIFIAVGIFQLSLIASLLVAFSLSMIARAGMEPRR